MLTLKFSAYFLTLAKRSQSIDDGGTGNGGGSSGVVTGPTIAPKSKGRSSKKRGSTNIVRESPPVSSHLEVNKFDSSGLAPQTGSLQVVNAITSISMAANNTNMHGSTISTGSVNTGNSSSNNNQSGLGNSNNNNSNISTNNNSNSGVGVPNSGSILSQQLQHQQQQQSQLQAQPKIRRTPTIEQSPPSTSRTPEVIYNSSSSSSFSGLKFGYEAQTPANSSTGNPATTPQPMTISTVVPQSQIKESPPSSPGSELGSSKKRLKKQHLTANNNSTQPDSKDSKLFQNGIHHAAHMLGNTLNPSSSMAKNMSDTLNQEIEAHIANTIPEPTPHVGPVFPGKNQQVSISFLKEIGRYLAFFFNRIELDHYKRTGLNLLVVC